MNRIAWVVWALFAALWIGFWRVFFSWVKISISADVTYQLIVFCVPFAVLAGTALIARAIAASRRSVPPSRATDRRAPSGS